MTLSEKSVSYPNINSYSTLNSLSDTTENVWVVFHGIGYLSRYFIKYFDRLPADKNYVIAPQAPSKYYLNTTYTRIGASWSTKENTRQETENLMSYLDALLASEVLPDNVNLIVLGFSQGVSIATRWVAQRQIKCAQLVLYAGGIPNEINATDFEFLIKNKTKVSILVGDEDEYLNAERRRTESEKINVIFGGEAQHIIFSGGHEIRKNLIHDLTL